MAHLRSGLYGGPSPRFREKFQPYTTLNYLPSLIPASPYHTCYPPRMSLSRIITALLLPIATARLTTLLVDDQITAPLRERAFNYFDSRPPTHPVHRLQLPYLVTCQRCVSVYAAAALLILNQTPLRKLINTLALSQLALTALDAADRIANPTSPAHPAPHFDFSLPEPTDPTEQN